MAVVRRRSALPQAPSYSWADVTVRISDAHDEPEWLRARRREAWEIYRNTPMPYQEEEWRRTDYRHIRWHEAERLIQANGASADVVPAKNLEPLTGAEQGGLLVFVDGKVVRSELAQSLARQGVIFTDLRTCRARSRRAWLEQHLMTQAVRATDGKFAALACRALGLRRIRLCTAQHSC